MTPDEERARIAAIAEGLSVAQRAAVLRMPESGGYIWLGNILITKPTANVLSRLGIFAGNRDYWREFTPLGLAVRAYLKEPTS